VVGYAIRLYRDRTTWRSDCECTHDAAAHTNTMNAAEKTYQEDWQQREQAHIYTVRE
jgi:hypothetical protein